MKKIILQFALIFMGFVQSCSGQDVDSIIKKYDNANFSELRNTSVYRRSPGHQTNTTIYFMNTYKGSCSPYVIEANDNTKEVVNINNDLVIKSCGKDYLSAEQIRRLFKAYIEYNLCLIQVDNAGNVYINPKVADRPTLLRKAQSSTPNDIKAFKQYRRNWYVRK